MRTAGRKTLGHAHRWRVVVVVSVLSVVGFPVAAQAASGPDLTLTMSGPAASPAVGEDFDLDLVVANEGDAAAADTWLSFYPSEGAAVVSVDPDAACDADPYAGVSCDLGVLDAGQTAHVTVTMTRTGARELWSGAWVSTSDEEASYDNNSAEAFFEADTTQAVDLSIAMTAPQIVDMGERFDFVLAVNNRGPASASTVVVTDYLPFEVEFVSATSSDPSDACGVDGDGALSCDLGTMEPDETATVTLTVTRTSPWQIWNSAWVSTAGYDTDTSNDYAESGVDAHPSVTADLSVELEGPARTPLVGRAFEYVLTVRNDGPSRATQVWLGDYLPDGVEVRGVSSSDPSDTCSTGDGGGGGGGGEDGGGGGSSTPPGEGVDYPDYSQSLVACDLHALRPGSMTEVTVAVTRTGARELWNSAWVSSSNFEPDYDDNYAELLIEPDISNAADLSVTMVAEPDDPEVGAPFSFVVDVTNHGPSPAGDVVLVDMVPDGVGLGSVASSGPGDTCEVVEGSPGREGDPDTGSYSGYREVVCQLGTLAPDESVRVTLEATRTTTYELWNSAWVSTSAYDPDSDDDSAWVLIPGDAPPSGCTAEGEGPGGSDGSDQVVVGDCSASTGDGADTVEVIGGSRTGHVEVDTGDAADTVHVNLAAGGDEPRLIEVRTGPGSDRVVITVAPGAGNATVLVHAGRGADTILLDVPPGVEDLALRLSGGRGPDHMEAFSSLALPATADVPGFVLRGQAGADVLLGGTGADILRGRRGVDLLDGGGGDDLIWGGRGADTCRDGPGRDRVRGC